MPSPVTTLYARLAQSFNEAAADMPRKPHGERIPAERVKLIYIDKTKSAWKESLDVLLSEPHEYKMIGAGETFEYRYARDESDPEVSFWMMTFFRGPSEHIVVGHTQNSKPGRAQ